MSNGIIIRDGFVFLVDVLGWKLVKQGVKMPLEVFLAAIGRFSNPPPSFFPVPRGVKFFQWVGDAGMLVVELEPALHTFRWIKDLERSSRKRANTGPDVQYETKTFALPYLVLVLPFYKGALQTGACQVFYRKEPLASWDDSLLMTNFLNVARGYGFTSWACMVQYQQQQGLSWEGAVEEAIRYFLWSAFNRSSEVHEGNSHYSSIRGRKLDRRISSASHWERASQEDPLFMLNIPWPDTGLTVRSAVDLSFSKIPHPPLNLINLVQSTQGGGNA